MLVWRICREPFADLSGEGARLYGGRWNSRGRPMIYTADTAALAVLEVRVHLDLPPELLPDDYVLLTIDIGDLSIETVSTLPEDPRHLGDTWMADRKSLILKVPSIIVPECFNFLINPAHREVQQVSILSRRRFAFDERLWRP